MIAGVKVNTSVSQRMYTLMLYGLFLFAFVSGYGSRNGAFLQFVKANALILSVTVLLAYGILSADAIEDIRQKYFPKLSLYLFIAGDILLHQMPLLYFGFPTSFVATFFAYLCIIIYYLLYRSTIPQLYSSVTPSRKYDVLFLTLGGVLLFYSLGLIIYRTIQ